MKNKKRSIFTKKQIIIMVIVAILAFIIILAIALNPTGSKPIITQTNDDQNLDRELRSIEDVVRYYDSTYYKTTNSSEDGYEIDIFVGFRYNLFEEGQSKESFFKSFYERIAMVTEFKSFRLIDQDKDITISVKCNNGKISEVLFNDVSDYYKKGSSVIYYQHKARRQDQFYSDQHEKLIRSPGFESSSGLALKFKTTSLRYYFFIIQPRHREMITEAVNEMASSEWSDHFCIL